MYLRSRLIHAMRRAKIVQKDVVERWLVRAELGEKKPAAATVRSYLNRLVRHEEPHAARFFFRSRGFASAILDALEVPDWERDELYAAAEAVALGPRRRVG